jgi:hypothetical protein
MHQTPPALRTFLLVVLALGLAANGVELLLLEHFETPWQWAPLVMIVFALVASAVLAFRPTRGRVWGFRAVMALMIVTGALGLIQHYRGNMLFELEMRPTMEGFELFRESMMGATPALAPGMMAHLGLIGLALTYRHPLLARRERDTDEPEA